MSGPRSDTVAVKLVNGLASGFGCSLGSLAPYLIGMIIIPGSLAPPISMVRQWPVTVVVFWDGGQASKWPAEQGSGPFKASFMFFEHSMKPFKRGFAAGL